MTPFRYACFMGLLADWANPRLGDNANNVPQIFPTPATGSPSDVADFNGDGKADVYETIHAWPLSGHYHEYSFGPKLSSDGSFFVSGNVAFGDEEGRNDLREGRPLFLRQVERSARSETIDQPVGDASGENFVAQAVRANDQQVLEQNAALLRQLEQRGVDLEAQTPDGKTRLDEAKRRARESAPWRSRSMQQLPA